MQHEKISGRNLYKAINRRDDAKVKGKKSVISVLPGIYAYVSNETIGKTSAEITLFFVNRYPEIRPLIPSGAEYKGSLQEKPRIKPATHPYTGPFAFENHKVEKTANIIAGFRSSTDSLFNAGITDTNSEYIAISFVPESFIEPDGFVTLKNR